MTADLTADERRRFTLEYGALLRDLAQVPDLTPEDRALILAGQRQAIIDGIRNPAQPAAGAAPLHPFTDGGVFIFDRPDIVPAVWGDGKEVLWPEGEACMLVGPSGVGKTTLANQVVAGLLGVITEVLGFTVHASEGRVLYLAMDRPQQIARSLKRVFKPEHRQLVSERLVVMQGPPPGDIAKNPAILLNLCKEAGASVVIVDSLKDAAIGLSEDAVGAGYNSARQSVLAAGIQVLELHHQVKRGENGKKPNTLADVFGSTWITGGAGSVILLHGQAGDPIVDLLHLKQPAEPVGPLKVLHDHDAGLSSVVGGGDPLELITGRGDRGTSVRDVAEVLYAAEGHTVTPSEVEKTRRKLAALERAGKVRATTLSGYGPKASKIYYPVDPSRPFTVPSRSLFDVIPHGSDGAITLPQDPASRPLSRPSRA